MNDKPKTTAEHIQALVTQYPGHFTMQQLTPLLPAVVDSLGVPRAVTQRQVNNQVFPMLSARKHQPPLMVRDVLGRLSMNREKIVRQHPTEEARIAAAKAARARQNERQNAKRREQRAAQTGRPVSGPRVALTPAQRAQRVRDYEKRRSAERKAARRAAGIVPIRDRALRIKNHSARQEQAAAIAQAIHRKELGLRDMPNVERPCTEAFIAANADKHHRLPSHGPEAVSPASRLRFNYGG